MSRWTVDVCLILCVHLRGHLGERSNHLTCHLHVLIQRTEGDHVVIRLITYGIVVFPGMNLDLGGHRGATGIVHGDGDGVGVGGHVRDEDTFRGTVVLQDVIDVNPESFMVVRLNCQ